MNPCWPLLFFSSIYVIGKVKCKSILGKQYQGNYTSLTLIAQFGRAVSFSSKALFSITSYPQNGHPPPITNKLAK